MYPTTTTTAGVVAGASKNTGSNALEKISVTKVSNNNNVATPQQLVFRLSLVRSV